MDTKKDDYVQQFGLFGPTLMLKDGVKVDSLKKGVELEFSTDQLENRGKDELDKDFNKAYFDGMNKFSYILENEDNEEENKDGLSWFKRMSLKMKNITEDGGVKKFIRKEGVQGIVPAGARVKVHYNGYIEDLDEPFDSTRLRNKDLQITLGNGEVISGLEIGISTMRKDEIARFLISSEYAYGKLGCPPRLPGNTIVLFEVELLSFNELTIMDGYNDMTEEEKKSLPFERLLNVAKSVNSEGNEFYRTDHYGKAIRQYMKTINTLETARLQNQEEEDQVLEVCMKAYMNMALCYLKKASFGKAIAAGRKVLERQVEHPKALYVCGKSLRHMGEFNKSRRYLLRAHAVSPKSKDVLIELKKLDEVENEWKFMEKSMCEKMFKH